MRKRPFTWLAISFVFSVASISLNCSQAQREKTCLKLYPWDTPIPFHPNGIRKEPCRPVYYGIGDGDGILDSQCQELQKQLMIAAMDGKVERIKELLVIGANAGATADSNSALQFAASKGHLDAALLLLNNGADVNHYHPISGSPLTSAIYGGQPDVVELLLSRGAYPNVNPDGGTALAAAKKQNNREIIALLEMMGARE